jgi:hypothetical protein
MLVWMLLATVLVVCVIPYDDVGGVAALSFVS